jgi:phosphate starvation-inducible protein PhoH and related proteins
MPDSISQGGECNVELIGNKVYELPTDCSQLLNMLTSREKRKNRRAENAQMLENAYHKGMDVQPPKFLTWRQEELWNCFKKNTVTLAHGCAGTGKTLIALHYGLYGIAEGQFDKVYYVRSDVGVEFQRGRGALPGDLSEKIAPLIAPVLDNLPCIMRSQGAAEYLLNKKIIEPVLLEDIRGRSLNNAFIIVDESQNFLPSHIKTCLSRVGKDSKICLIGDTKQTDLEVFRRENGLVDAIHRLRQLAEVGVVEFQKEDIVRNSVIAHILDRYDD